MSAAEQARKIANLIDKMIAEGIAVSNNRLPADEQAQAMHWYVEAWVELEMTLTQLIERCDNAAPPKENNTL